MIKVTGLQLVVPHFHFLSVPDWVGDTALVVFIASWIGLILTWFQLRRNRRVAAFRMELIQQVFRAAHQDLEVGRDPSWRWEALASVEYDEMLHKFWRPLDSFYPDRGFTEAQP